MRAILIGLFLSSVVFGQNGGDVHLGRWRGRTVAYRIVNGLPIAQGDIVLDQVEDLEQSGPLKQAHPNASGTTVQQQRWPNATIPYVIDPAIPNPTRVTDAVQHWNSNSIITMIPRTTETNYVRFVRDNTNGGACSSTVGMIGGEQRIQTDDSCSAGALIHELGHAVGLNHEQERIDRDQYVAVNWDVIDPRRFHDFDQAINGNADFGLYDYGSIMHYSATTGFENTSGVSAMQTIPFGIPVGQRAGLSPGDLDAVSRMYGIPPAATVVTTVPAGLDVIVDGARVTTPAKFNWAAGSSHTLDVPDAPQGSATIRYAFARWTDSGDKSHTITATPDITVYQAAFVRQFFIAQGVRPAGAGSMTIDPPSPDGFYTDGTPVIVTATPAAGYSFYSWTSIAAGGGLHGLADNPAVARITNNFDYTANFLTSPMNIVLDTSPPHRQVTVDNLNHNAVYGNLYGVNGNHTIATQATQFGPSAVSRYVFTGWSDNGATSHTVVSTSNPATYTANFRTDYLLSVTLDGGGTVERIPASADGFYESGTQVQLIPHPAAGFQFVDWIGDVTGTGQSPTITVNGEKAVLALFRAPGSTPFNGILNAATQQQINYVCPGEILVINGTQAAPAGTQTAQAGADGTIASTLADTRVSIGGQFAPVLAVNGSQVTTMVPFSAAGKPAVNVQIVYANRSNTFSTIEVVSAVPGIFTVDGSGSGGAKVTNEDGSDNSGGNPAARGSTITFQGTGFGTMSPTAADNAVVGDPPPVATLPVTVSIGGVDAPVVSAQGVPGNLGGLVQVTVQVPDGAPSGAVPMVLKAGTQIARQHVTVAIQ